MTKQMSRGEGVPLSWTQLNILRKNVKKQLFLDLPTWWWRRESTDWKFYPLNTIIFLWALQEARDKKIRQRKDPMGEVANPPIWLRIKILHCTRVMLNHSGHMITHDDKTRPSNLFFCQTWGEGGGGRCVHVGVWGNVLIVGHTRLHNGRTLEYCFGQPTSAIFTLW